MKKFLVTIFTFVLFLSNGFSLFAEDVEQVLQKKLDGQNAVKEVSKLKTIDFRFKNADLVDVINLVAAQKYVNIILPMGAAAIKSKVNINISERLTVDEAWDLLYTILDVAGYNMLPKGKMFSVVKTDPNIVREPMGIYISEPIENIPSTDEMITYLAYFSNLQVGGDGQGNGQNVVSRILKEFLSKDFSTSFRIVPEANGVVVIDKANNIKSIMKILNELDKVGFRENLEIIRLNYASADVVANLFNLKIMAQKRRSNRYRLGARKKSEVTYFDSGTKVIPEGRTNSVILIGMQQSINRIKDFIENHIDVPSGKGQSILHRKKLQYLNAEKFAVVLKRIVGAEGQEGAQSRPGGGGGFGPERFFDNPIITTDRPNLESDTEGEEALGLYRYSGTNSLIIAAKNDDWLKIEKLIDELDQPIRQIIIEVLVADLTAEQGRALGSQLRNLGDIPLIRAPSDSCQSVNVQSAQLVEPSGDSIFPVVTDPPIVGGTDPKPATVNTTIAGDLMNQTTAADLPFVSEAAAGSSLLTLSDKNGKVWDVLKFFDLFGHIKILSHPYIVAVNHKLAQVIVGQTRRVDGPVKTDAQGAATREKVDLQANLDVKVTPRIGGEGTVNLEVNIVINEFSNPATTTGASAGDRNEREVKTNANIKTGDILVLGGLIRSTISDTQRSMPILGSIPVLGWLFKSKAQDVRKNNLTVFIRPTIVEPMLRAGIGDYTKDYIRVAKSRVKEGMIFDTLRDPITRWFFLTDVDATDAIDAYTDMYEKKPGEEKITLIDILEGTDGEEFFTADNKKGKNSGVKVTQEEGFEKRGISLQPPQNLNKNTLVAAKSCSAQESNISSQMDEELVVACSENTSPSLKNESFITTQNQNRAQIDDSSDDELKELLGGTDNPFA